MQSLNVEDALRFGDPGLAVGARPPSPLPRAVLLVLLLLLAACAVWLVFGRLDVVAVAHGKLVPKSFVKIVQPAEGGIVRDILVVDGARVREGDVLLRMDGQLAETDAATLREDVERRRLQLRRIDSELGASPFRIAPGDDPELAAEAMAQTRARRRAHADALAAEAAARSRALQDLASAVEIENKLSRVAPIVHEQALAWEKLAREGYAGRLLALERQRQHLETDGDLKAQSRVVAGLREALSQADGRMAQITSSYRQQLHAERIEAATHLARLRGEQAKHAHRHRLLELRAPQAGVVNDLAVHTRGTVLAPGAIVMTLVPEDEPLLAEVWLGNADSGAVRAGQRVRLKLVAFPFQKHGWIDGIVEAVSADAREPESAREGLPASPSAALAYRTRIRIDGPGGEGPARPALPLRPGMALSAEIHLGRRSVLEYLLSPVQRTFAEAGRER